MVTAADNDDAAAAAAAAADKDDNIVGDVVLVLVLVVVVVMGIYTEDDNREGDNRDDLQRRRGVELPVYRRDDVKAVGGAGAVWVDSAVSVVAVAVAVEELSWYARFLDDRDDEYNYCHPLLLCSYYSYGCYSRYYYNY